MEFRMKQNFLYLIVVLIVILLLTSMLFYNLEKPLKRVNDTSSLFVKMDSYQKGINQPVNGWQFTWKEGYDKDIGVYSNLSVDDEGNCYFCGWNNYLYAVSSKGILKWNKKAFISTVEATKDGFIITDKSLFDNDGSLLRKLNGMSFTLGNDGLLYGVDLKFNLLQLTGDLFAKKSEALLPKAVYLIAVDKNNNKKISYKIPEQLMVSSFRNRVFFDTNSNIYYLLSDFKESEERYYLFSLNSQGSLRWYKKLPDNVIIDFTPNGATISNTILIAYDEANNSDDYGALWEERRNKPKHLIALSTSTGEELWNYDISDWGYLNTSYAVGTDYRFYFAFSAEKETILHAFSESGKLLWRRNIVCGECTSPIVDSDNHVYIGVGSGGEFERYLYSFYPDGKTKWKLKQPNAHAAFDHSLVLGPNQTIYYCTENQNIIYTVKEKSK